MRKLLISQWVCYHFWYYVKKKQSCSTKFNVIFRQLLFSYRQEKSQNYRRKIIYLFAETTSSCYSLLIVVRSNVIFVLQNRISLQSMLIIRCDRFKHYASISKHDEKSLNLCGKCIYYYGNETILSQPKLWFICWFKNIIRLLQLLFRIRPRN